MNNKTTTLEGVLCVYEDGELVAVARKNGGTHFYKCTPLGFDELGDLLGANVAKLHG